MSWIAIRMLTGDVVKYLGMIFGVAFSTLLIAQQSSIFIGLINRSATIVFDVRDANIWVMDARIRSIESSWPLPDTELYRVKSVPGVAWAAPFLKAGATLETDDGNIQSASLIGVDDTSLVGLPHRIIAGSLDNLRQPGAVFMNKNGYEFLFRNQPIELGKTFELNDTRAVLAGIVESGTQFTSQVSIFTRYKTSLDFTPGGRNRMSFIIAKAEKGHSPEEVAERISNMTGLKALSSQQFESACRDYIIRNTGIPISFGTVVLLGILVGMVVVALTFTIFIRDNLKQFGALKAIGVTNIRLIGMVGLQGLMVGVIGYSIGIGLAALVIGMGAKKSLALRAFYMPWQVAVFAAIVVLIIISFAGFMAFSKVLKTDPASVFRG